MTVFQQRLFYFLWIGLITVGQVQLDRALRNADVAWIEPPAAQQRKQDPNLFRAMVFGQVPVAIDWLLLKCLVDTTLSKVTEGKHNPFYYDLELVTDLDPKALDIYLLGGNLLAIAHKDITGARDLLIKGNSFRKEDLPSYPSWFSEKFWKVPWRLNVLQAYLYLFELNDMPNAAISFREAAQYEGVPLYLQKLDERFRSPGGQYEVGLRLLKFLEEGANEEHLKKEYQKKYLDLFIGQYLYGLNSSFVKFLNSQPSYRAKNSLSSIDMKAYWQAFLHASHLTEQDPWGGRISLNTTGKVVSTTPHEAAFGLE